LLFVRHWVTLGLSVFNRCPRPQNQLAVLSCIEHERLKFELGEVRTRGQYLTRLHHLSRGEREEWDRREQKALSSLVNHELEHGCRG